ncbi:hypothetical protein CHLRE_10g456550v5 [Chlamydomonas reinhardtii]|uniref:Uncharacterized protein n=1 Tax=Chlamydomonas reinhardtii TaxID=3055 RepID=A0A2K3DBK6_CHLRE|nr:uncharacterized protein CHLRE_10g456550v5 [Chlamydomonas reinhardtii]PNW77910.1 hypothetical protein CHLRE_10g456550v5 [Chlamydomonas reinhardtii]
MGGVSEAAVWPEFTVRGVHGGGATLKSLGDVRRLVLPAVIKDAMRGKPELVDDVNDAVLEPLLEKDAGRVVPGVGL